MKTIAMTISAILVALVLSSSASAGVLRRIDRIHDQREAMIERQADIAHRHTSLLNIPAHIAIEVREFQAKRANDRDAAMAMRRAAVRRPMPRPVMHRPMPRPVCRRTVVVKHHCHR